MAKFADNWISRSMQSAEIVEASATAAAAATPGDIINFVAMLKRWLSSIVCMRVCIEAVVAYIIIHAVVRGDYAGRYYFWGFSALSGSLNFVKLDINEITLAMYNLISNLLILAIGPVIL